MKTKHWMLALLIISLALIVVHSAVAMSSANYRLDWFTALTGSGGSSSSAHYAVNLTVGQTVIGPSTSAGYHVGLGYWYGTGMTYRIYLPVVLRS